MIYYVYIVITLDKSLYCGYTNNLEKRIFEHNNSSKGAKYTRTRRPVKLVYSEEYFSKSEAMKREYQIKQLTRQQKLDLISSKV